jgi:CTD small phosphatase-like protein 2
MTNAGINIRPKIRDCLLEANKYFRVVVFTASEQEYADPILDYLDPDNSLFIARYYRQHCVRHVFAVDADGGKNHELYVKDLRIFQNVPLTDIVLVDNSLYSFAFQLDNGIPIIPFYDEPNDQEMTHLIFYLSCLRDCPDVRELNRDAF